MPKFGMLGYRAATAPPRPKVHQKEEAVIDPETRRQLQELVYMLN